jgi:hypothetical protein
VAASAAFTVSGAASTPNGLQPAAAASIPASIPAPGPARTKFRNVSGSDDEAGAGMKDSTGEAPG